MSFLQNKYNWLFGFFDYSKNGFIEIGDFEARADRASTQVKEYYKQQQNGQEFLAHNLDTIKSSQLDAYRTFFHHLVQEVDKSADGSISSEEWLQFCDKLRSDTIAAGGDLPGWFKAQLEAYFDNVLDFDKNGAIDFYELGFMGDAPVEVTWYCYDFLTEGGTKALDKVAFIEFAKDYMISEDESHPSRYMFGFLPPRP